MKELISILLWHIILILLLFRSERNDRRKNLFKTQPWNSKDVILILLAIDTFGFIVYFFKINKYYHELLISYIFHIFLLLLLIFVIKIKYNLSIKFLGFRISKRIFVYSVCGGIANFLIMYSIYYYGFKDIENSFSQTQKELQSLNTPFDYFVYLSMTLFLGPIVEEFIFRGILYSPYRKKYGLYGGIFINAFLFAVSHYGIPVIPYIFGGVIIVILYEKMESIIAPIIAHIVYNICCFFAALYYLS